MQSLEDQTQGLDPELQKQVFDAYIPYFGESDTPYGQFKKEALESLSTFLVDSDLGLGADRS